MEPVTNSRRDEIVQLRKAGLSYVEIGRRFGITRERVRQIVKGKLAFRKPVPPARLLLTAREVASQLGVHINTVRRWDDKGILKAYRVGPRGDRRYRREDIEKFLRKRRTVWPDG